MRPICKIGCILENLAKKAPNLPQIGCFLQKKWYRDGSQSHAFRGIEMVEILKKMVARHGLQLLQSFKAAYFLSYHYISTRTLILGKDIFSLTCANTRSYNILYKS